MYVYQIGEGGRFHGEIPCLCCKQTLSMLRLPKRLALRLQDYSVSMLSLSFVLSLSDSILSIP